MTIGVLRPRVLLPAAADDWSAECLHAVLVHELGHVCRRDTLIQTIAQVGCALYWWNPLAWLAAARLRIEREHACDDLVLGAGVLPSSYATNLLAVARSIAMDAHVPQGASCMVDRSWTQMRLVRILDAATPRGPLRTRVRFAMRALGLAGVVMLACTSAPPVLRTVDDVPAAPASMGTLSVGTPEVHGPITFRPPAVQSELDLADVSTEVKRRIGNLEQCYERRLAVQPAMAGTVVIHWAMSSTGEVMDTCVTKDTVGDRELLDCVSQLVAEGPFPAPRDGAVDVSFPFVFSPRRGPVLGS